MKKKKDAQQPISKCYGSLGILNSLWDLRQCQVIHNLVQLQGDQGPRTIMGCCSTGIRLWINTGHAEKVTGMKVINKDYNPERSERFLVCSISIGFVVLSWESRLRGTY